MLEASPSPASTAALNVLIADHPISQILFWIGTNWFNSFFCARYNLVFTVPKAIDFCAAISR
jgi:hypothetical protein